MISYKRDDKTRRVGEVVAATEERPRCQKATNRKSTFSVITLSRMYNGLLERRTIELLADLLVLDLVNVCARTSCSAISAPSLEN